MKFICLVQYAEDYEYITNYAKSIDNEIKLLKKVKHPFIVEFIDHFFDNGDVVIILEYCQVCTCFLI